MLFNAIALALLAGAQAVLPVVQIGNKFYQVDEDYNKMGKQFTIVGVDYQIGGSSSFQVNGDSDVLSNGQICLRDAYALQKLGANTIRVYSVSPWLNHDECMSIFNDAGIYVMVDLNNPYQSLTRQDPGNSYNEGYLNNVFGLVDAFKYYPNLLGFFAGNEVVNQDSDQDVPKYLRAVQRDVKQYINLHANRTIPVGYSAASIEEYRYTLWNYLQCGDEASTADFYGLNSYEWCGDNDWESSGYGTMKTNFGNSSIPVFFSEYGCNKPEPREFNEVTEGLYDPQGLGNVFSGGLVYEYAEEANQYGLVDIDDNGDVQYKQDYVNLKNKLSQISLPNATQPSPNNTVTPPSCSGLDTIIDDFDLPDCPAPDMLQNGGGNRNIGHLIDISNIKNNYTIEDVSGNTQSGSVELTYTTNWQYNVPERKIQTDASSSSAASTSAASSSQSASATATSSSSKKKNAAVPTQMPVGAAIAAMAGLAFL